MNKNEEFALYLLGLLGIAAILSASESWAWIGLLILLAGMLFWVGLELATWVQETLENRHQKRKKREE